MWSWLQKLVGPKAEPKRAREKGKYKADDKSTADVNEAWVGGKAPMTAKQKRIAAKKHCLKENKDEDQR